MDVHKALEIRKALNTLSEALGLSFQETASNVCFLDKEKFAILKEASDKWVEFGNADIVERGAMLGVEIVECDGGYKSEIVLSEE